MNTTHRKFHPITPPAMLITISLSAILIATWDGIGLRADTMAYFKMTENLLYNLAFPPGYPILLKIAGGFGIEMHETARILNIVLITANVLFAYFLTFRSTHSNILSFSAGYLILSSPNFFEVHTSALSDASFIFWCLAGLFFLMKYLETDNTAFSIIAATSCSFAFLTRFAGAPLIATGVFSILFFSRSGVTKKIFTGILFTIISIAPMLIRFAVIKSHEGPSSLGRKIILNTPGADKFTDGAMALSGFLLPSFISVAIRLLALISVVICLAALSICYVKQNRKNLCNSQRNNPPDTLPHVFIVFICSYAAFLVAAVFADPKLTLAGRYMIPLYISSVILLIILVNTVILKEKKTHVLYIVLFLIAVFAMSNTARLTKNIIENNRNGIGYTSTEWRNSQIIKHTNLLDISVPVYTNGHDAIFFLTGHDAQRLPLKTYKSTGKPHPAYKSKLEMMKNELVSKDGVIVYFNKIKWRHYLPSAEDLEDSLPLQTIVITEDGTIYKINPDVS